VRSYPSFLLIALFVFGTFPDRVSARSSAVRSEFCARARSSYVEGDLRLSLGQEGEPNIGKEWIDAVRRDASPGGLQCWTLHGKPLDMTDYFCIYNQEETSAEGNSG